MKKSDIKNSLNLVLIVLFALGTIFACLYLFQGINKMIYVSLSLYALAFIGLAYIYIEEFVDYSNQIKRLNILKVEDENNKTESLTEKQQVVKRIKQKRIFSIVKASLSFLIIVFSIVIMFLY